MADSYKEWIPNELVPPPLQGEWSAKYLQLIGAELDETLDELTQAVRAPMPGGLPNTPATDAALALIGRERQLERYAGETAATYAERLRQAWVTWKFAGSHFGLLEQLYLAGFDSAHLYVVQKSGKRVKFTAPDTLTITQGAPWTMDAKPPEAYASFGLLFTAAQPAITWDAGAGFSDAAAQLNRIAWRWRPARAEFWGTQILGTGASWGLVNWGAFNWGGTGGAYIPPK